jgi:GntR family transcriptional regulator
VVTGTLETGERLPTVRQLAIDLSVPPTTVERAYRELEELGVVSAVPGQGVVVSLRDPDRSSVERRMQLERLCREVAAQAEGLGFTLDDLMEVLAEQRRLRRAAP